ncbi:hypothetical protein AB3S75_018520 [Citrus x aurantiifolia]
MENLMTGVKVEAISDSGLGSFTMSLQRRIEFHPARKPFSGFSNGGGDDGGDFKLETLNPSSSSDHTKPGSGHQAKKVNGSELWDNGLDPELSFGTTFRRIGAGLENLGNTCFLNSVLQCLTYTEPLAAYLQSGKHQSSCHIAGFCALCAIQKHVSRALQATGRILAPKDLVLNLRCISRNFRNSRQEDAHEYMVNLLESMHKCCLPSGVPSESANAYEKSLVHKIFGGRLRSQVKCTQCSYCSNKFDPFLDLSLEIAKADSVLKALNNFTAAELLDGGEKEYHCQRCKQKVRALKQLTVYKAPYVLTIHLKRFRAHDPGQKNDKKVQFGSTLDMKPFVSGSYEGDLKYTLYGVLVHHGWSTHSGHYYCFVRTSSGMWYSLDDNRVVQVNERSVLEQKAYMLFYVRDRKNIVPRKPTDIVQKENLKANVNGNKTCSIVSQPPKDHPQSCPTQNGGHGTDSSAAARHKAAVNGGLSKETHLKSASVQPARVLVECSVPKKDTLSEPSARASLPKNPLEGLSIPNADQGKSLQPSVLSNISNDFPHNTENNATAATAYVNYSKESGGSKNDMETSLATLPNCNETQTFASKLVNESSQKINLVSNDSNDKKLKGISNMPLSGNSTDKWLKKSDLMKIPNEPRSEKQVGDNYNNGVACNSPNEKAEDNCQAMGLESVELSTASVLKDESLPVKPSDCVPKRKLKKLPKCQIKNMAIGLKFFRTSLGLRMKKHKKSKRRTLDPRSFSKELLSGRDCSPSSVGPSNSDNTSRISRSSFHSRKKLANDQQLPKHSDSVSEANQQDAVELGASKDGRKHALLEGMSMLTRGLEETTIAKWDGIDLHPHNVESNGTESVSIGYVLDDWDEEYDRGKRKKLRQNRHSFGGPNPFQEIAAKKTRLKKAKLSYASSADQPFRI